MTQELLAVILEQKSYNSLKAPEFRDKKQKIAAFSGFKEATRGCDLQASTRMRQAQSFSDQAISRNSRRRIFPTGVIGNDSRSTMCLGTLYAVKFSLQ